MYCCIRLFLYCLLEGTGWQNGMFMEKKDALKVEEVKTAALSNEVKESTSQTVKKKKPYVKHSMFLCK